MAPVLDFLVQSQEPVPPKDEMNAIAFRAGRTPSSQGTKCVTPSLGPQDSSGEFLLQVSDTPSHLPNPC